MTTRYDVVVAGGGPAGSATATLLARRGVRVLLLERARFPRPKPCAEYVSPGALGALARLGVLPRIEGVGAVKLSGMRVVSPDGTAFTGSFAPAHGLALPRATLDTILLEGAADSGVEVREETAFDHFTRDRDGSLSVSSRRRSCRAPRAECRAPLLIGADGLNSRVATQLGVARRGRRRWLALVTHATGVAGMRDIGEMHVTRHAYVGLSPVGPDLTNVAAVVRLGRHRPATPATWLARTVARLSEVHDRLTTARFVEPVRAVGPFARTTSRATDDGVMLVGDAADFYDPFTGEGIRAALYGAELAAARACDALAAGRFGREALGAYDRDRFRAFGGKWVVERLIGVATRTPRILDHVARRIARRPGLADRLVGVTGGLLSPARMFRPEVLWQLVA